MQEQTMTKSNTVGEKISDGLLSKLDRGIDDMEAGRELPLDEAFDMIEQLVEKRMLARAVESFKMYLLRNDLPVEDGVVPGNLEITAVS